VVGGTIEVTAALLLGLFLAGGIDRMERRAFDLVNRERVENGLEPLEWHPGVAQAARDHAIRMAGLRFFSHTDPEHGGAAARVTKHGIRWSMVAENIYFSEGYADPAPRAVQEWMASPGHRDNILTARFTHSGVGTALSADGRKRYFVQIFLAPRQATSSSR
jgi:uncharacterized protein YkwD